MKDQSVIKPTHTPTPWFIKNGQVKGQGLTTGVLYGGNPSELWQDNAAFIVRAVNAYDGLIEALKEIAEGKGAYSQNQFEHCKNTVRDMKALAIEALAKAEGKE